MLWHLALALALAPAIGAEPPPTPVWPNMINLTNLASFAPEILLEEIRLSPLRAIVPTVTMPEGSPAEGSALPIVTGHGMGDSCFEGGFKSITKAIGHRTGSYAVCIPTGDNILTDTLNGYLMNMDKSVDVFAEKIRKDPKLAGGFNAIGFSQGNSLIRGYIQKYNDPPVNTFVSVHGTVMGVAAFPICFQQGKPLGLLCKALAEVLGDLAYLEIAQDILFQAGYYRAPTRVNSSAFLKHSQIAQWNNENPATANATLKSNFAKTKKFAMVKALKDEMVYPNEGEWWGAIPDGSYGEPAAMKDTKFYTQDLFGLKEADVAGEFFYESTPGGHLEFTDQQLYEWIDKYIIGNSSSAALLV